MLEGMQGGGGMDLRWSDLFSGFVYAHLRGWVASGHRD